MPRYLTEKHIIELIKKYGGGEEPFTPSSVPLLSKTIAYATDPFDGKPFSFSPTLYQNDPIYFMSDTVKNIIGDGIVASWKERLRAEEESTASKQKRLDTFYFMNTSGKKPYSYLPLKLIYNPDYSDIEYCLWCDYGAGALQGNDGDPNLEFSRYGLNLRDISSKLITKWAGEVSEYIGEQLNIPGYYEFAGQTYTDTTFGAIGSRPRIMVISQWIKHLDENNEIFFEYLTYADSDGDNHSETYLNGNRVY